MKNYILILLLVLSLTHLTFAQWTTRNSGTTTNLKDVCYIDPFFLTIVGENGAILRSSNSGYNWFFQQSGTLEHLNSVEFMDAYFGICVGNNGIILRTIDGGINWEQLNSGSTEMLYGISCFDNNNCVTVGANGSILKTSDGGNTWIPLQSGSSRNLLSASYMDLNNIIIVGLQTLIKSTNGGIDWTINSIGSSLLLRGISCIDSDNCFVVGTGTILYTNDGGNSWVDRRGSVTYNLYGVSYNSLDYCNAVGSSGNILGTTNAGLEWMDQPGWTNKNLFGISFINPDSGIVVGNSGVIRMTYSAGIPVELTNFTAIAKNGSVELNWSTATETNNHIFEIERRNELIYFITIGYVEGAGTTTEPQEYKFIDRNVEHGIYIYRLKQIDFDGSFEYSDEVEVNATGRLTFKLYQNYPNPFNPVTSIKYSVSSSEIVTLKVYDILGNEIATLVNEEKQPGTYEVEFSTSSLPTGQAGIKHLTSSGVYFYQVKSGNFVETKKMLLLK